MPYAIPLQSLTGITVTTFRVAYITAKLINLSQHNNRTTLFLHPHSPTTPPWHNTNCQFITPHTKSRDAKSCVSQAINGDYNMPIITGINCAIFLGRRKILRIYRHTPLWWNNINCCILHQIPHNTITYYTLQNIHLCQYEPHSHQRARHDFEWIFTQTGK